MRKKKTKPTNVIQQAMRHFALIEEHPKTPQAKRVNTILELLVAIRNEKRFFEKAEMLNRLQSALRRYQWSRVIYWVVPGDDQRRNPEPHVFTSSETPRTDDDDWEYGTVHILLLIAEYYPDYLGRIDRCCICRKWMLTRKSDQRFCSGKCRQHEYDNDPERKEQHRANMRRLYRLEKERAERAKQRAKKSLR